LRDVSVQSDRFFGLLAGMGERVGRAGQCGYNQGVTMSLFPDIFKLPLRLFGLKDIPAVPVDLAGVVETLIKLDVRAKETQQAIQGLTGTYTIGETTALAYRFLFGDQAADEAVADARERLRGVLSANPLAAGKTFTDKVPEEGDDLFGLARAPAQRMGELTALSLDRPEQFSISWTCLPDVVSVGKPFLSRFAGSLSDAERATADFWPTIADFGLPFNLILPKKLGQTDEAELQELFGDALDSVARQKLAAGRIYGIDLRIFAELDPHEVDGFVRFTPSTYTLLLQNDAKELRPVAVRVTGKNGNGAQVFTRPGATDSAWLYALQAAKTSVTVYGIWLGHVYHWHIVTAPMQMTLINCLPKDHPISQLLRPQSNYLITFDDVLLVLWREIAPPTSVSSSFEFLKLMNAFAKDRQFLDDDPRNTLRNLGIDQADFTDPNVDGGKPWNRYPLVRRLLDIWDACNTYVGVFVDKTYQSDQAVADDRELQEWSKKSSDEDGGNVRGLPAVNTRNRLASVLTSLVFRIVAHGTSRLFRGANPALSFVANFPPCLQNATIPEPSSQFDTKTPSHTCRRQAPSD
jgi:Lipoxygenase